MDPVGKPKYREGQAGVPVWNLVPASHATYGSEPDSCQYHVEAYGCFHKLEVHVSGVLIVGALLFWFFIRAPDS